MAREREWLQQQVQEQEKGLQNTASSALRACWAPPPEVPQALARTTPRQCCISGPGELAACACAACSALHSSSSAEDSASMRHWRTRMPTCTLAVLTPRAFPSQEPPLLVHSCQVALARADASSRASALLERGPNRLEGFQRRAGLRPSCRLLLCAQRQYAPPVQGRCGAEAQQLTGQLLLAAGVHAPAAHVNAKL